MMCITEKTDARSHLHILLCMKAHYFDANGVNMFQLLCRGRDIADIHRYAFRRSTLVLEKWKDSYSGTRDSSRTSSDNKS